MWENRYFISYEFGQTLSHLLLTRKETRKPLFEVEPTTYQHFSRHQFSVVCYLLTGFEFSILFRSAFLFHFQPWLNYLLVLDLDLQI